MNIHLFFFDICNILSIIALEKENIAAMDGNFSSQSTPMEDFMTRMMYFGLRPKVALVTDSDSILQLKPRLVEVGEKMDVRSFRVHWDRARELTSLLPTLDASDCDIVVVATCNPVQGNMQDDEVVSAFARMKTLRVTALGGVAPKLERCADFDLVTPGNVVDCLLGMAKKDAVRRPEYMSAVENKMDTMLEREVAKRVDEIRSDFDKERASLNDAKTQAEEKLAECSSYAEELGAELEVTRKKLRRRTAWLWVLALLFVVSAVACAYFAGLIPMLLGALGCC